MSWGELPKIGTILQAQWRALGIDVQLEQMSYPAALEAGHAGQAPPHAFRHLGDRPEPAHGFFTTGSLNGFNWAKVSDPELDAWLEEAAAGERLGRSGRQLYAKVPSSGSWTRPGCCPSVTRST